MCNIRNLFSLFSLKLTLTFFFKYLSEELDVSDLAESIVLLFQNKARHEGANDNLCAAMDELSNALNTQQVQSLMKDFEREHSDNPNFKLWSSYIVSVHSVYKQTVFYGLCLKIKYILSYLILYEHG